MTQYAHDHIVPDKLSNQSKKQQVAQMFNNIAFKYDFLNRFLSAGIDIYWRKKAIAHIEHLQPKNVLDVATGTADVALMTHKMLHPKKIVGIDISEGMLDFGRKKIAQKGLTQQIQLFTGDSENIHFPNQSFDAVTVAFGVRNFQNLLLGLQEMHRVLQYGGKLVVLEFSKPSQPFSRWFYGIYMRFIAPGLVQLFKSDKKAYEYLNDSVNAFPEGSAFIAIMQQAGFTQVYQKKMTLGICSIYCGTKAAATK